MKSQSYMTRALKARDPRYASILGKLGYERTDLVAADSAVPAPDDKAQARLEYKRVLGKNPPNFWDAATLREKIAAAQKAK